MIHLLGLHTLVGAKSSISLSI